MVSEHWKDKSDSPFCSSSLVLTQYLGKKKEVFSASGISYDGSEIMALLQSLMWSEKVTGHWKHVDIVLHLGEQIPHGIKSSVFFIQYLKLQEYLPNSLHVEIFICGKLIFVTAHQEEKYSF